MKRLLLILPLSLAFLLSLQTQLVYSASASMYLAPASGSAVKGSHLTVDIRENSGDEPVNAAEVKLSYPTDLLSFVSIRSSAAFGIAAQSSGGGGSVKLARGALPAVRGNQSVATVVFKVLKDSGQATVSIDDGAQVLSEQSNKNILGSLSGAKYTLKSPEQLPPPPPPPPPPMPPDKRKICKEHEEDIKTVMVRIADRGQKLVDLYTTVATRAQAFYEEKGKKLNGYDALVTDVDIKKETAQLAIEKVKLESLTFDCDATDPRAAINNFKNALKDEITSLQAYKESVKKLVNGVKSAQRSS